MAPPGVPDEVFVWLCEDLAVRSDVVAAMRSRLTVGDWPDALLVADALLGRYPSAVR